MILGLGQERAIPTIATGVGGRGCTGTGPRQDRDAPEVPARSGARGLGGGRRGDTILAPGVTLESSGSKIHV